MAKSVRVKIHNKGFRELRNSPGVLADLESRVGRVKRATGAADGDYSVGVRRGKNRGRAGIITTSLASRRRNRDSAELLRALDAGR